MKSKLNKLVIVGGGINGWFTAGYMKKKHPWLDIKIIESDTIPIIGVGESVVPQVNDLLETLGLEERDWMSYTNSIYKLGNKFVGLGVHQANDTMLQTIGNAPKGRCTILFIFICIARKTSNI